MKQQTFAAREIERLRKPTCREQFLLEVDKVVPRKKLCKCLEPFYPEAGNGLPPVRLERMLRICFLQYWFNLSDADAGAEEALYESCSMCRFVGIDLGRQPVPDETTILNWVNRCLRRWASTCRSGACALPAVLSWASALSAPRVRLRTRTRRAIRTCAPRAMASNGTSVGRPTSGWTQKTKQIHSAVATAANVHDSQVLEDLLHGDETRVCGDSAYSRQTETLRQAAPAAQDFTHEKGPRNQPLDETAKARNRAKPKARARVEHIFAVINGVFGITKVRYRGLDKTANALFVLCALTNLYLA